MELDIQQMAAIRTESKMALVLAGAGSGKTATLTERIAYLVETQHVSPSEILAFSFTRKASQEIRTRLETRLGKQSYGCTLGTMHGIALNLIHRFGEFIGLKQKSVTVYGEFESQYLLKEIATDMGIYNGKTWKIKKGLIDQTFRNYYERGVEPEEEDPTRPLFKEFIRRCFENNSLTYGSLLIGLKMLIPQITQYLQYNQILVDEIQDIDPLQWQIIHLLREACDASLFVVGDLDQSIFEWRGAVPGYLIDHQKDFDIYTIETNYRSVPSIVNAANNLIQHNVERLPKEMHPSREEDCCHVRTHSNMDSAAIAKYLKDLPAEDLGNYAIITRVHVLLKKLSDELTALGVDHVYVGEKTSLVNSENFRKFHAFLKLIINPYDNFSVLLARDLLGISREKYNEIRLEAIQRQESHFQTWVNNQTDIDIFEWISCQLGESLSEIVDFIASRDAVHGGIDWPFDVTPIVDFIKAYPGDDLAKYLDWLATYDISDEIKESHGEKLQLIVGTVHMAKGLEWPTVIIAGCNEGIMPSKQALKHGELEAERRLMYVAMTRAQDNLILAVRPELTVSEYGKEYHNPVSRFIGESQ